MSTQSLKVLQKYAQHLWGRWRLRLLFHAQINFVYGTPHRRIGKRTMRSLRSLPHDRWVPERDGCPNTCDLTTYVDMCCTTLEWRDARVYQWSSATCNRRNLFVCGPRNDAGCRDNCQTCPCYIPFHTDDNNNFSLETSHWGQTIEMMVFQQMVVPLFLPLTAPSKGELLSLVSTSQWPP